MGSSEGLCQGCFIPVKEETAIFGFNFARREGRVSVSRENENEIHRRWMGFPLFPDEMKTM